MISARHVGALLACLLALSGCTTLRPVSDVTVPAVFQRVEKGDHVRIETTDGRKLELDVIAVDRNGITGKQRRSTLTVPYAEIATLEVAEFDWFRTVGGVFYAGAVAVQAAYIVAILALFAVAA